MTTAGRLRLHVGTLRQTGSTQSSFDAIYVGLVGKFEIRFDDAVLYEEEEWNGVEFAVALAKWLGDPTEAFVYQSMDADDPWLVRFTFEQAGWRVEAWHGHRARQLLPLEDLLTAAKECIASVDSQLKMNFNTELARYA